MIEESSTPLADGSKYATVNSVIAMASQDHRKKVWLAKVTAVLETDFSVQWFEKTIKNRYTLADSKNTIHTDSVICSGILMRFKDDLWQPLLLLEAIQFLNTTDYGIVTN